MPKYKEGDKVKVLDSLVEGREYYMADDEYFSYATGEMRSLRGKTVTITEADEDGYYIEEDDGEFNWTDSMFAGLDAQYHIGDKVMVRSDLDDLHAPAMRELAGREVTITGENVVDVFGSEPGYSIAEDDGMWVWHANDFADPAIQRFTRTTAPARRSTVPCIPGVPVQPTVTGGITCGTQTNTTTKNERKKSKMKFDFKKMLKQYMPHAIDDGSVALSISGDIVYQRKNGDYVFYDPESKSINNCMDLVLGSEALDKMVFVMPVKDVSVGDVVLNGGKYIYITNITASGAIKGVSLDSGRTATLVKEINTVMGYCPYAKVTSLFTMMNGKGAEDINPMFLMLMGDADSEDDLFTTIAMMTMMGGNAAAAPTGGLFGGINPLMLMALSGGDDDGESGGMMKMLMLSQMMGGGLFQAPAAVPAPAPVVQQTEADEVADAE